MKFFTTRTRNFIIYIALFSPLAASSQSLGQGGTNTNGSSASQIPTAVPFLLITPDSRSGAMGEAGVAISPDVNATFWNPSKLAFLDEGDAVSATLTLDDAKPLFLEFQKAGVAFHQTLRTEPWGARTFIVQDLDGNLIAFAGG